MKLAGKVALVTGAGRGIGRAIALKLAGEGAHLVVNDLDAEPAGETAHEIRLIGGTAVTSVGSILAPEFSARFVKLAVDTYGGLDIIVNNAGYTWDGVIQNVSDEQWQAMLDVHLTGPFRILRAAQPVIRSLQREESLVGRRVVRKVVNVSSMAGLFGNPGQTAYASAKAGIVGMTKTLAKEWGRLDVTVNCVAYGLIETRLTAARGATRQVASIDGRSIKIGINPDLMETMLKTIPLGRSGTVVEAAGAAYLFCIPESDYVSGEVLMCSGGLMSI